MTLTQLGILYGLIGVGCAAALSAKLRAIPPTWEVVLLAAAWPLYGPFVLMQIEEHVAPKSSPTHATHAAPHPAHDDLSEALRRAQDAPLAQLLPDAETGRELGRRLDVAAQRVAEIDRLLSQNAYCLEAATRRKQRLRSTGDERAARMVDDRLRIIRRLQRMREEFVHEINQVTEIVTQLHIQAEVVRIAGATDAETRELVEELVCRMQGLEEMLEEESLRAG